MDMSRLSTCSFPLRNRPVEEAFRVIADAGFNKVDLVGAMPHLSLDPAECDPAELKAKAESFGLRIANLGTYVGKSFASEDKEESERELAQTRRAIDLAHFLGARSIRVMPGDNNPAHIDRMAPWFQRAAEYTAEKRVYLGFENHGQPISGNPANCRRLAEKVGSPHFGVLYDPGNLFGAGVDYRAALETMDGLIAHAHFKDFRQTAAGPEKTMLGEGEIDFPWIIRRLDKMGYGGDFAVEYELKTESPDTGMKKWFAAAQKWRDL
ncbi:MAG: sugar phosphate isomerase/epimerase [Candidatus Sumerlaeota bacterium]|nr:sugar phosphate isomerase/epimerase [Candidatus Sumerlaeota bacterium]